MKNPSAKWSTAQFLFGLVILLLFMGCGGGGSSGVVVTADTLIATLAPGASQSFTAQVTGAGNGGVTWHIQEGAAGGTLTNSGSQQVLYTAPGATGTYHLIATSQADPGQSVTIVITVTPQVGGAVGTIG